MYNLKHLVDQLAGPVSMICFSCVVYLFYLCGLLWIRTAPAWVCDDWHQPQQTEECRRKSSFYTHTSDGMDMMNVILYIFFSHSFHGLQFSFRQWMWRRIHVMCTTSACCFLVIVTWSNAKNHFSFSPTFRKKKKLIPFAWPSGQNSNYLGPICIASQFPPMSFWFPTV